MTAEQKRRLDEAVWVAPQRMTGTPCFRGTRVPVQSLIDFLEDGEALDRFLHEFQDAKSFQELAREQDVRPVANIADFAGVVSESDALDDLLEEIYRERE